MYAGYTLDQLTVFVTVAETGSFSAAGRRLNRVQSAISYAIAQLEDTLGTRLFDRRGRTPTLTDAGRRLAGEARLVLGQARELTEVASQLQEGTEAELRLMIDAIYPSGRLAELCASFSEAFPATTLRLDVGLLGDAVDAVRRGEADLGACNLAGARVEPDLVALYLGTVSLIPVCAAHHPLADREPPHREAWLRQSIQIVHSERREAQTADQGVLGSRTWRVTDLSLKVDLIAQGVGWGSLPTPIAEPMLEQGRLVRLHPEPWPPGGHDLPLHAVTRPDQPLGRAGQWFRRQLVLPTG